MTSVEEHKKSAKTLLNDISEKVRSGLVGERQKLIGFSASEASCDLLALLLHKKNLITPGFNVNHRFFASERTAREKLSFEFSQKTALVPLLVEQERYRNLLCYGREKSGKMAEDAIQNLAKIKEIVENAIGERL